VAAAAVLSLPGVLAAVGAVLLIQLQLLLDCSDGEVARWRQQKSPVGVYLDRIGHWLTEAALPIALGVRADGGWDSLATYTALGLVVAVLVLLVKGESALVTVARAESGLPLAADTRTVAAPRASGLARLRRWAGRLPFFRAFVAMEATLLALAAAIVDAAAGDQAGSRVLVIALIPVAALTAAGHFVAGHRIVKDEPGDVERMLLDQLANPDVQVIITTGGTGITSRDHTYEAIGRVLEKRLEGFGELFRMLSYQDIGSAAMMSRACAGTIGRIVVVSLPGSEKAVRLAMDKLVIPELAHLVQQAQA
jgi:molybdenum cofactor synthesis domain-containing protein